MRAGARGRLAAALAAAALVACGCTDDAPDRPVPVVVTTAPSPTGQASETTTTAVARGGTLTVGALDRSLLLDPLVAAPDGTGRGTEMLAVYDALLRFDPSTGTYTPRLAESLVANAARTEWTLTVRDGVRFSDATLVDAAAVKFALDRYRIGRPDAAACAELRACGRRSAAAVASMAGVVAITVTGARTLTFTADASADIAHALATEPGMIPSPTALRAACPQDATPAEACPFARAPVGAGAFVVQSMENGVIDLARNTRHWAGESPLDRVRFVPLADEGTTRSLDQLTTGVIDMALLIDARAVTTAQDKRFDGHRVLQYAGAVEVLNHDAEARPATRFLRVRLAIAAAVDSAAVHGRVTGRPDTRAGELVPHDSALGSGHPPKAYDPERARALVAEAKANGWSGTVRYLCDNSSRGQARAIAMQTMLEAAGITVVVDTTKDRAGVAAQVAARDFDVVCGAVSASVAAETGHMDGTALLALTRHLSSGGDANRGAWRNATADQALRALGAPATDAERRSAAQALHEAMAADVPLVVSGIDEHLVAWHPRVRGVAPTTGTRVFLGGASRPSGTGS